MKPRHLPRMGRGITHTTIGASPTPSFIDPANDREGALKKKKKTLNAPDLSEAGEKELGVGLGPVVGGVLYPGPCAANEMAWFSPRANSENTMLFPI